MKRISLLAFLFSSFFVFSSVVRAAAVPPKVDNRGLIEIPGVLRAHTGHHWGAANLVAWGPNWQGYAQQDYAMKDLKKWSEGGATRVTGLLQYVGKGVRVDETLRPDKLDGNEALHVTWTLRAPEEGGKLNLARAIIQLPLAVSDFGDARILSGGKEVAALPKEYDASKKSQWFSSGDFLVKGASATLRIAGSGYDVEVCDARAEGADKKDKQRFEIRLQFKDTAGGKRAESTVDFRISGTTRGFVTESGADWTPLPWTNDVKEGSILDFSNVVPRDAPAGKLGFARVSPDGHFVFERDARKTPRRFVGGNLCFDANFLTKEQADRAVRDFTARGWNAIRFHHIDVTITKDQWNDIWNRRTYPEIDPAQLDRLDYLLAACKKAGIYVTFDLYAMGCLGSCEGFDKPLNSNTIKAIVPIHKPAEDLWFRRAMEIFDHVNPYTGVAWKEEPTVLFATLLNEDSIASVWSGAKAVYIAKYNEWAKGREYPEYPEKDIGKRREFAEFLYEVKADANRRMAKRLRDAGVKTLVSGGNWWDNMAQTYEREALDVVDNHQYSDHPQGNGYQKLPFQINNTADIQSGHPTYATPIMMAPTRVWGKPFTVTEWNFCNPNKWRAEAGLMMGAYASLQDWDGLYRFAWSHSRDNMFKPCPAKGFDIVTDPIGQLTERQVALLFGRRDASPAKATAAYGVTAADAFGGGLGDMWAKNLFPHPFTQLAYTTRIGSFVADGKDAPAVPVDKVYTAANKKDIPVFNKVGASDNGEISIDHNKGSLAVNTPRTAGVCSTKNADLSAGPLAVTGATTFCAVSASSMDGRTLEKSGRVLVMFLTDVVNTEAEFTGKDRKWLASWGKLPYLVKTGSANISLASEVPGMTLWAVAPDGTRLGKIPTEYRGGAYRFALTIKCGDPAATMIYELAN